MAPFQKLLNELVFNFNDGLIPSGWTTEGCSGFYPNSNDTYEGEFSLQTRNGGNCYENLYTNSITGIPIGAEVTISFNFKEGEDQTWNGYFNVNGSSVIELSNYGSSRNWYNATHSFTNVNTSNQFYWRYYTNNNDYLLIDNFIISWTE